MTYNKNTGKWYGYKDGVQNLLGTISGSIGTNSENITIGRDKEGFYSNCSIGEILIFNRELSNEEINNHYLKTKKLYT